MTGPNFGDKSLQKKNDKKIQNNKNNDDGGRHNRGSRTPGKVEKKQKGVAGRREPINGAKRGVNCGFTVL